jgi:hypothetical protein
MDKLEQKLKLKWCTYWLYKQRDVLCKENVSLKLELCKRLLDLEKMASRNMKLVDRNRDLKKLREKLSNECFSMDSIITCLKSERNKLEATNEILNEKCSNLEQNLLVYQTKTKFLKLFEKHFFKTSIIVLQLLIILKLLSLEQL